MTGHLLPVKVMLSYTYLHNAKTEEKKRVQNGKVISLGTLTTPTYETINVFLGILVKETYVFNN